MADLTKINWTRWLFPDGSYTEGKSWNPWEGCTKIFDKKGRTGCHTCYMFRGMARWGRDPLIVRRTSTFNAPLKKNWNNESFFCFTCSYSDWFHVKADPWRDEAWDIVRRTPHIQYLILTKRTNRVAAHLPKDWGKGWPNVWLGFSAENQRWFDVRVNQMKLIPARVKFVSFEPLIGPIDITGHEQDFSWGITGGESGYPDEIVHAEPEWFKDLGQQMLTANISWWHKQNGGSVKDKIYGEWGGRELDGQVYNGRPEPTVAKLITPAGKVLQPAMF